MWLGMALACALSGIGLGYVCWRVGRMLRRAELDLHRTVDEVVPIIAQAGVSMTHVNDQLGKVDVMLDSAVDMTDALDTTVRAVSHAVTDPIRAVSTTVSGVAEAARSFREHVSDDPQSPASATTQPGPESAPAPAPEPAAAATGGAS